MTLHKHFEMLERWDGLYRHQNFAPKYPHETVVRWVFKSFPRQHASNIHLLDVGCGLGRHALFFAAEGYQSAAVDFSPVAIEQLDAEAKARHLSITTQVADCKALPFETDSMDGLLSYAVLYYCCESDLSASISEIHRVLKPGGKALVMVKARTDSRFIYGSQTGNYAACVGHAPDDSWHSEVGLNLLFFDRDDLKALFSSFNATNVDLASATYNNGKLTNDDFIVTLTK